MWWSQQLSWFVFVIHFELLWGLSLGQAPSPDKWQAGTVCRYSQVSWVLYCSTNPHCGFVVMVVLLLARLYSWGKGDNHDLLLNGVWHFARSRLKQVLLQSVSGWPCYSDCFGRSLSLQSHIIGQRENTASEFLCSQGTWLQPQLVLF